jgi:hypothetical protein
LGLFPTGWILHPRSTAMPSSSALVLLSHKHLLRPRRRINTGFVFVTPTADCKTLVRKLQVVQNEAIKIISGAFRTTPREPLHHLLNIFPIDLRLRMLTDNSAMRLYRLQKASQVLIRLGKDWHPTPGHSIPTPTRTKANTALRALASRVDPDGPHIESFPNTPPGTPNWEGRVTILPIPPRDERRDQTAHLVDLRVAGTIPLIFINAAYTNKGRHDDKSLGAAVAVLYYTGKEWGHAEHVFRDRVTRTDAEVGALTQFSGWPQQASGSKALSTYITSLETSNLLSSV